MEDYVLTYEELRNIQRKERINRTLQPLEPDFFQKVVDYLNNKKALLEKSRQEGNRFSLDMSTKINNELSNAQRVLKDVLERRESKVILQALMDARAGVSAEKVSNMINSEKDVYKNIFEILSESRKQHFYPVLVGNFSQELVDEEPSSKEVTLLSNVPEFLWKDSNTYGPFTEGDTVELPADLAEFLLKQKKAVPNSQMEKA